jgi:hypothetical protein
LTVIGRLLGGSEQGLALGAMASYRAEGFAEIEGEIELGALFSVTQRRFHASTNVVVGTGVEESEVDGELKLRLGYDLTSWLRAGVDGRFRCRLGGDRALPGGRVGDAIGGPELLLRYGEFLLGASAGPSTVGVADGVGWTATMTLGGVLL